jgi:Ala-tRNA(Pro) deacylase
MEDPAMPAKQLKEFLDSKNIKYVTISHSLAYTAQEVAASAHIPGKELAKTVVIKVDGDFALAVLPASFQIDFARLKEITGGKQVELAEEGEFRSLFPGSEVGAMPPFGNLYGMKVYVTESLAEDEEIAFSAGSHTELIRMKYKDFESLVKPTVARFSSRSKSTA